MRNTLILIGQIHTNQAEGLDTYHAVVEATVQRARPVVLTALAAVLAFIPLTQSVFWGSMAYTLIGGTAAGTVLILVFPARALRDLVPGQADDGQSARPRGGRAGSRDCQAAPGSPWPPADVAVMALGGAPNPTRPCASGVYPRIGVYANIAI